MESVATEPETPPASVRTLAPDRLCPVCEKAPLRGRQEVCSPACRAARWRRQRAGRETVLADLLRDAQRQAEALARRITEALG